MQPILLFLDQTAKTVAANTMAQTVTTTTLNQESINNGGGGGTLEIVIRRVGMEDHINIVKLFQVCYYFIFLFFLYH